MKIKTMCSVIDCETPTLQKGYCAKHYMKWYRHGDANYETKHRGRTPTVISWTGMKQRCSNPNDPSKKRYRDRGITYDTRWELFDNFLEDMGERPNGMTLDRIDNNKGYSKDNCRWATPITQMNNTSMNRFLEVDGIRLTHTQWSRRTGIPRNIISWRHNNGWSPTDIIQKPVRKKTRNT